METAHKTSIALGYKHDLNMANLSQTGHFIFTLCCIHWLPRFRENRVLFVFLRLGCMSEHNGIQLYSLCCKKKNKQTGFHSFCNWIVFCNVYIPHFLYPVSLLGVSGLIPHLSCCELTAINMRVQKTSHT